MTNTPNGELRLSAIESRLDRFEGEAREQISTLFDGLVALSQQTTNLANRVDQLTDGLVALSQQTTNLANRVDQLTEVMIEFARNAEADRATIRENQTEIRRIWEYLLGQSGNGHRGTH